MIKKAMTLFRQICLLVMFTQSSLVTLSQSCNRHFHWMAHGLHVTCNGISSDFPRSDISVKGGKGEILF